MGFPEILKIKIKIQGAEALPIICLLMVMILAYPSLGQEKKETVPDGTEGLVLNIHPEDSLANKLPANEFNGSFTTLKIGFGYIGDYASFSQSKIFKQQMDSAGLNFESRFETRDARILVSGIIKTKRAISWKTAYMYDGDDKVWMIRETGFTIGVPELAGHIFIGRTKEGYSLIKVMNGHSPWTGERQMALDVIPILADGIKWFGYLPKSRLFWNLGYFNDLLSKGQSFSTYSWQYVARIGWLAFYDKEKNKVLHIATNLRYGKPLGGKIILKSKPESSPAPIIITTGSFSADHSTHIGGEIYYSTGRLLIGSEVMLHKFNANASEDHNFFGGDIVATYFFTKTKRPYTTTGSIFGFVPVRKSVFKGGWGEWEVVLRFSSLDLDDGSIQGGKFWRITPMLNWYMSRVVRMEFIYGYGVLERYNLKGGIQLFQTRIQFTIM